MKRELTRSERIKHRNTDFKNLSLEYQFVGGMLFSKDAFTKNVEEFNFDALTSDRLKEIYKIAVYVWNTSGDLLSIKALRNSLQVPSNKIKGFLLLYKKCKRKGIKLTLADVTTSSKKLMQMYIGRCYEIGLKDIISDLGKSLNGDLSKIDSASEKIERLYVNTITRKVASTIIDPAIEYPKWKNRFKYIQEHPEEIRSIYTGIDPIDNCMRGIRPSELAVIIAPTSIGKSIALMNIATYCCKTTGSVVIFTIEMPAEQYLNRLYCEFSGIDYEKFRNYELIGEEWEILDKTIRKLEKLNNKLYIVDMPSGCTSDAMRAELEIIMRHDDIKLICCDYMNIMGNMNGSFGLTWEFQVQTAAELKLRLARKLKLPCWSAAQSTEASDVAFARHIKDQIDVGIVLTPTDDYVDTKMLNVTWCKTRDFEGIPSVIYTDRNKMKIFAKKRKQVFKKMLKERKIIT